jgi:hypothetical protein
VPNTNQSQRCTTCGEYSARSKLLESALDGPGSPPAFYHAIFSTYCPKRDRHRRCCGPARTPSLCWTAHDPRATSLSGPSDLLGRFASGTGRGRFLWLGHGGGEQRELWIRRPRRPHTPLDGLPKGCPCGGVRPSQQCLMPARSFCRALQKDFAIHRSLQDRIKHCTLVESLLAFQISPGPVCRNCAGTVFRRLAI